MAQRYEVAPAAETAPEGSRCWETTVATNAPTGTVEERKWTTWS
jgi:hypothetical protein